MSTRAVWVVLLAALPAVVSCGTATPGSEPAPPVVKTIDGAPAPGTEAGRSAVSAGGTPKLLSSLRGAVAVGTTSGLMAGTPADDPLSAVPVVPDPGGADTTGAVDLLARRSGGGLLVHGASGLYHDDSGVLLSSPLNAALGAKKLVALDAIGSDDGEELWICTGDGALQVTAGAIAGFHVVGAASEPEVAVGVAPGQAVVAAGGDAFFVDLSADEATKIAAGLGKVNGHDRSEDGTVYLATEAGLLTRTRSGELTLRTFAAAGEKAQPVVAVASAFGVVVAAAGSSLIAIDPAKGSATKIGALEASPGALAVDANGDVWALDGGALFRFQTGAPVSFAADVKPFFEAHCTTCHATGSQGAPKFDLTDYATAKDRASTIVKKLEADGVTVMPPVTSEVLTAAEYGVVTRWVAGAEAP